MNELIELTKIDFTYVFIAVFIILIGIKVIVSVFEWGVDKLRLETKRMRKRREEHDLLIQTSQGLASLQEHHKKDVARSDQRDKEIAADIKKLTQMFVDKEIDDMRWEINNFATYVSEGKPCNKDSFQHCISSVIELDTALTDLKKTTAMTSRELEDYYYASNDAAKQMGVSTKEILEQAAAWSRLGFNTAEAAAGMAQLSAKFASISPGMTGEQAREGLAGIMKAWGLDTSDVEREVMDNINALGKAFGESNADIVAGMKGSAAALAAAGTSYRDAFALFAGAQEVLQNAEAGGRALRSISLRIRGYSENSDDGLQIVDEELKNIARDLMNLTQTAEHSRGVSIFREGSATEFKSLVQYFGEINKIWDEMSQKQQNDFLEKAFGKNQAQAGAAFIQNYDAIADAIEAMKNAAGSSEREMSIVMDSLEYKLNHISETGTSIAQNLFHRDDMKSVIDVLDSFMGVLDKVTEKLGLFKTIGLGAGLLAGFQNVGKPKMLGFNYC